MKVWVFLWSFFGLITQIVSAEFLLYRNANSGTVVAMRALYTAVLFYLVGLGLLEVTAEEVSWHFNWERFKELSHDKVPWFGALFGAVYLAYYARFSAQWAYLGALYNTLMSDTTKTDWFDDRPMSRGLAERWAAFIEDAEELHLVYKMNYAVPVYAVLRDPVVREVYLEGRPGRTEALLDKLRANLSAVIGPWEAMQGDHGSKTPADKSTLAAKVVEVQQEVARALDASQKAQAAAQQVTSAAADLVRKAEELLAIKAKEKAGEQKPGADRTNA